MLEERALRDLRAERDFVGGGRFRGLEGFMELSLKDEQDVNRER